MKTILDHFKEKNVQAIHEFARAGKLAAALKMNREIVTRTLAVSSVEYFHYVLHCFDRQLIDSLFNNYIKYSQIEYDEFVEVFRSIFSIAQEYDNTNTLIHLLFNTAFSQTVDESELLPKSIVTVKSYVENAVSMNVLLKNAPPYLEVIQYLFEQSKASQKHFSQSLLDYTINMYVKCLQQKDCLDFYKTFFLHGATLPIDVSKTLKKRGIRFSVFSVDNILEYSQNQCANLSAFNYNVYTQYKDNLNVLEFVYNTPYIFNKVLNTQFDEDQTRHLVDLNYIQK